MYVRIGTTAGGATNANVPLRSSDPRLEAAIATAHVAAFEVGNRVSGTTIAALGGDTLQRLTTAAEAYARSHPADYPNFAAVVELRWAERVIP